MLRCLLDRDEKSSSIEYTCTAAARSLPFYLQCYGHDYSRCGYFIERSGLKSFLLIYTFSGCGLLRTEQGETRLTAGSVAMVNCDRYQYYCTLGDGIWNFVWLHFDGAAASQFYSIVNANLQLSASMDVCFPQYYDRLCELTKAPDTVTDIRINALITSLLSSVICTSRASVCTECLSKYRESLEKAAHFIRQYYGRNIGIKEIAAVANMSQYHFERYFKAYYGKTPYEFLTAERINAAKCLLTGTRNSIAEIADLTGFSDSSSFIRRFKSATGVTPLKYRLFIVEA